MAIRETVKCTVNYVNQTVGEKRADSQRTLSKREMNEWLGVYVSVHKWISLICSYQWRCWTWSGTEIFKLTTIFQKNSLISSE
jgi:hypothetical protein